jgi:predicted site-specific integrase-resolvase
MYTLGKAAKYLGYVPKYLQRLDREGKLVAYRTMTNQRYYTKDQLDRFLGISNIVKVSVAYCRVSSQAQRPDLKNQRSILENFCITKGYENVEYIEEIGGGLSFKRPLFQQLVLDIMSKKVDKLIIAHKDRLSRFGFELIKFVCDQNDCKIICIESEQLSPEQEMVQDLMTIVHCFSSRLYGLRNYKKSLKEALKK